MSRPRARKHPKLARAPLTSVICQARYTHVLALDTEERQRDLLAQLQDKLHEYPLFSRVAQQSILLSSEGIQPSEQKATAFQFSSEDEEWVVAVATDSVSLQTRKYDDFRDFQQRWRGVAEAVRETLAPTFQTRFGLRYVDELYAEGANTLADWVQLLKPALVGLGASDKWREHVRQSFQELVLEVGSGICTLRHGFLPTLFESKPPFYLLDVDCYVEGRRPFDPASQEATLDNFNDTAYDLFRWSMRKELYESYEPEPHP